MITYDVLRWVLPNTKCENSFSLCFIENDRCVTYPWTADAVCDQWIKTRIYGFCFLFFLKACHKGSERVVGAQLTWHRSQGIGRPNARQSLILQTVPIDSHWYCMLEAGYRYNFWERVFKFPSSWVSVWSTERLKLTFLWAFVHLHHLFCFLISIRLKYGTVNCASKNPAISPNLSRVPAIQAFTILKTNDFILLQCSVFCRGTFYGIKKIRHKWW